MKWALDEWVFRELRLAKNLQHDLSCKIQFASLVLKEVIYCSSEVRIVESFPPRNLWSNVRAFRSMAACITVCINLYNCPEDRFGRHKCL